MTLHKGFVEVEGQKLEYLNFGSGAQVLALHGFGDDAYLFQNLKDFEVHALSLPYHGKTLWNQDFTPAHLLKIIEQILPEKKFILLGFSMGGKIAICISTLIAERIERLVLMAPDGISTHRLYDTVFLSKYFKNKLLHLIEKKPEKVLLWAAWARRRGLISKFLHDFGHNHLNTSQKRQRLFLTWSYLENFRPNLSQFETALKRENVPILLFLGKRDRVIKANTADFFLKKLPHTQVIWLDKGHLLVEEALAKLPMLSV
jgi:pimeloyl-ACP methyl ester carboxylesterase